MNNELFPTSIGFRKTKTDYSKRFFSMRDLNSYKWNEYTILVYNAIDANHMGMFFHLIYCGKDLSYYKYSNTKEKI